MKHPIFLPQIQKAGHILRCFFCLQKFFNIYGLNFRAGGSKFFGKMAISLRGSIHLGLLEKRFRADGQIHWVDSNSAAIIKLKCIAEGITLCACVPHLFFAGMDAFASSLSPQVERNGEGDLGRQGKGELDRDDEGPPLIFPVTHTMNTRRGGAVARPWDKTGEPVCPGSSAAPLPPLFR